MSKVELTFIKIEEEHVTCKDDMGQEHCLPDFMFDGIPKLWRPNQKIYANLTPSEIESNDIFI